MSLRRHLFAAAGIAGAIGVVAWRLTAPSSPTVHLAVLRDRSTSTVSGCDAVAGLAMEALQTPGVTRQSRLIALATGDRTTGGEPTEFARISGLTGRSMESAKRARIRLAGIATQLGQRCEELPPANVTPLYLAMRRAVEALSASGCAQGSDCRLLIQTDGAETVEPSIRRALTRSGKPTDTPVPLDNRGITVLICGLAETRGLADPSGPDTKRTPLQDARRADRTREVLRRLFVDPAGVKLAPHCPTMNIETTVASGTHGARP